MHRILSVLLCLALSGCDFVEEALLTPADKIHRAFPPSVAVRVADERLHALLADDAAAMQALKALLARRYELRALKCAQNLVVGRFDSVQDVQGMAVDRECLHEQDAGLQQYLQARLVGVRLSQPALRPLKPLGAAALAAAEFRISSASTAAAANVAVLSGARGELASFELPGAQLISHLRPASRAFNSGLLSSNGRLLSVWLTGDRGLSLLDTELGDELMLLPGLQSLLAWLPEQQAALVTTRYDEWLMALDFLTGEMTRVADIPDHARWVLPLSPGETSFLVVGKYQYNLVDCQRSAGGLDCRSTRVIRPAITRISTSGQPLLLDHGRALLIDTHDETVLLDLQSGSERRLWSKRLFATGMARLSATRVLLQSLAFGPGKAGAWVLDIEKDTLAPVLEREPARGAVSEMPGRNGFIRRVHDSLWLGDQLQLGEPLALADYVAQREQAREEVMRRIDAGRMQRLMASQQSRPERLLPPGAADTPGRIGSPSADRRPMPPAPPATGGRLSPPPPPPPPQYRTPTSAPAAGQGPMLAEYATGARIASVGVYQSSKAPSPGGQPRAGEISLELAPSSTPLVLVLSSYEPVVWKLNRQPGTRISLILLSSHHPSQVVGAGDTPVQLMTTRLAYQEGSEGYQSLNREVQRLTGKGIDSFQGRYQAERFSVGGR